MVTEGEMKKLLMVLWLSAVLGCSTIERKVEGLDGLKTTEHVVAPEEIWPICRAAAPLNGLLTQPLACAWINFAAWTCDYYVCANTPQPTVDHELQHCKGWDHGGQLQGAFDKWKAQGGVPPAHRTQLD